MYLGVAAAVYWLPAMVVAAPIAERKGRSWVPYGLLGWIGVFVLALMPPNPDAAERVRRARRKGMNGYRVIGPENNPRQVRVPVNGPGSAGLRSSLARSLSEGPASPASFGNSMRAGAWVEGTGTSGSASVPYAAR
jgi:hypothetical protein